MLVAAAETDASPDASKEAKASFEPVKWLKISKFIVDRKFAVLTPGHVN